MVSAAINWFSYGASSLNPNIAVSVQSINAGAGPRQLLDRIKSVRIDNLGNNVPVYVTFPDTNYTVVAPPNSVVWEPVRTGQFNAIIIGEGFTSSVSLPLQNTTVFFCNFFVPPFIDQEINQAISLWLASANITHGNSILQQNYNAPAVGDQFFIGSILATAVSGTTSTIFNFGAGFIYITNIDVIAIEVTAAVFPASGQLIFESTGISGIFAFAPIGLASAASAAALSPSQELLRMPGNFKIDGTQTWRLRWLLVAGAFASGSFELNIAFSQNPN